MTKYLIKSPIKHMTSDSRQVTKGSLFLAYPGDHADGRQYIQQAISQGASAVIWDPADFSWKPNWKVENIAIEHLRHQASRIADQFYDKPSEKMWMVGVTGTNGKTSITQWISQCYNLLGKKSAVIGTLGNGLPNHLESTINTTPEAVLLQSLLADYVQQKIEAVAMEVSSHGLDQGRVSGVHFDVAVFSNLSRDHLDYHGSYEKYAEAKSRLFKTDGLKFNVLNHDDGFTEKIKGILNLGVDTLTYGIHGGDVRATKIYFDQGRFNFEAITPFGAVEIGANLLGRFNVYNVLAVLTTLIVSKVSLEDAAEVIANITSVNGRMQKIGGGKLPLVVVDYAHTPDALENVLQALKEQTSKKLICVFGCGGNRDIGKRALMGKIASELADAVVVTSDNPRNEPQEKIIQDILEGVDGEYAVEEDRAKAIEIAVLNAQAGDTVLIAGKGHEQTQEFADHRIPFNDIEHAAKALKRFEVMPI